MSQFGGLLVQREVLDLICGDDSVSRHIENAVQSGVSKRSLKMALKSFDDSAQKVRLADACGNGLVPQFLGSVFLVWNPMCQWNEVQFSSFVQDRRRFAHGDVDSILCAFCGKFVNNSVFHRLIQCESFCFIVQRSRIDLWMAIKGCANFWNDLTATAQITILLGGQLDLFNIPDFPDAHKLLMIARSILDMVV